MTMDNEGNCDIQGQKFGAMLICFFAIFIQLQLLPADFYIVLYNIMVQTIRNGEGDLLSKIVLNHDY